MGDRRYFGTDGIRGTVGVWPISADFVLRLGRAAGEVLVAAGGDGSILIGKDTRRSGYMFESALEAGLIAAGADVRLLGPMPTPAVAMLTRQAGASAGIVISASHNPHFDHGIKFFSAQGEKLSDELERAIESAIDAPFATVKPERLGKARRMADAAERYLGFCRASVPPELSLTGLRVVVDCAHGANYQLA
ncbi:MAG: phosphoglucosamine mutase, partial [Pseudomonadota bacterium]